ncbi:MAG: S8 family serine peptidase [Oscillospiraceae bacterium]|nr:S8 family serine peptidase [Oscillospiraceae bacterium]
MRIHPAKRLLSLVLALVMVLGLAPCAGAEGLVWRETDLTLQPEQSHRLVADSEEAGLYAPTDSVRVSIVLEDEPTIRAGFATGGIALNPQAVAHDRVLSRHQKQMEQTISAQALEGRKLDVVWNLTLIANIISANVPYGALDEIRAVSGVREVRLERKYSPDTAEPQTYASGGMTGAVSLWESGYTGAGSRVAIIDTGTDTDHQSFDNGAFLHALKQDAAEEGISFDRYLEESIDLLDTGDVNRVLRQLNVTERIGYDDASSYYLSEKLPFAANYVDKNLVVDHDHDYQGSHGSHVAGIAAANRFIPVSGGYADARTAVSAAGAAPDAQIITMKVFGNADGPYDSDYFAAIEDAIWLGCDSVNLSLGGGNPGSSYSDAFADLLEYLETTDTVVVMSAGNSGRWADHTAPGQLYADGVSFHTAGEPGTYTNSLAVASVDSDGSGQQRDDYTISSFSSWGVPGSLELKPELAAPGGGIWSVDGMDTSGTGYEYMSGTSMAAPQVTGMTAQLAQYIRERGLEEKTGLSIRQLSQSLLMSTAVPLREGGSYYPVLAQGAGFARVDLAASAESLVTVQGQEDGKVKVELGEDARREGVYTFAFTLHNLTDSTMIYDLRADLFTQGIRDGMYLDTATRALAAEAVFTADGKSLASMGDFDCDLNGDGITSADDADHLLEYLLGNVTDLHADGDLDGNGQLTSYDAHLLLTRQTGAHAVTVPAKGDAEVEVTLTLTDETRALLEKEYPDGAYIEGFVYAEPEAGVPHSIPVLGWYGSWTDAGMFDVGGWVELESGTQTRMPYLHHVLGDQSNYLSVNYGDGREYLFGGNPYVQEEYLPRRNAFNNQKGHVLQTLRYSLIRNAAATRLILDDVTDGKQLICEELGAYGGAYYHVNTGSWMDTQHRQGLGLDLAGIPENTELELRLEAAPELYRTEDGSVDWTRLQEGGVLSFPFTIDNTAPQVLDITQEGSDLRVQARDNQYIAAVALLNASGTGTLDIVSGDQLAPDTVLDARLDLSRAYGTEFLVAVYDYAENVTVCEVQVEQTTERPRFTAADRQTGSWYGLRSDGTSVQLAGGDSATQAAEYVDGYVFRVDDQNRLWVGSDQDLYSFRFLSELDPTGEHEIFKFNDLAYSTRDKLLYGNFYSDRNGQDTPYLCTIDLYTGALTELGALRVDTHCMTVDDEGTFYAVGCGTSKLYTFRADTVSTGKYTLVGSLGGYATTHNAPLAWDHELDELYWACADDSGTELLKLDPETAEVEPLGTFSFPVAGLYIAGETVGDTFAPTDRVTAVRLPEAAQTIAGSTVQLSAQVLPWNIRDDSVIWSSGNTKVATVDETGLVTGISGGTAVITAASRLDSSKRASCTVTVEELSTGLKGIVWDETGAVWFSSFQPDRLPDWQKLAEVDVPLATTAFHDGILYAGSIDTSGNTSDLYTVNPETFALTKVGGSSVLAYTDLCYAPSLDYLVATYFNYIALVNPATGEYIGAFDWSEGVAGDLVGITHVGSEYNQTYGAWMDSFLILDDQGNVYREAIIPYRGSFATFNGPETGLVGSMGEGVDYSYFQGFHFDGSYLYWSRFTERDNIVELRVMDVLGSGAVYRLGYFPEGVWPVGGLYTDAQIGSNALSAEFAAQTVREQVFIDSVEVISHRGGLNSVRSAVTTGDDDVCCVDVTYERAATNGILRVEYDESKLVFAGLEPGTHAFAYRQEPGAVELAFAHGSAIPAGEAVASLSFRAQKGVIGGETALTLRTRELGQEAAALTEVLTVAIPLPHNPFADVPAGSFFHIPVLWAVQQGITSGTDATHFSPGQSCNRAQVVTFLWAAAGRPEPRSTVNPFTDVPKGSFCEKAVLWAVEKGITSGTDATHFSPLASCNRATVVTFLWAARGKPTVTSENPFTDVPAGSWYEKPILWAKANGITSGLSTTEFGAASICNRAQVVTFLYAAFGK